MLAGSVCGLDAASTLDVEMPVSTAATFSEAAIHHACMPGRDARPLSARERALLSG